ncbi:MAG: polyprenyl synthetase family protein [Thermodesulfobacteriota bacterium]
MTAAALERFLAERRRVVDRALRGYLSRSGRPAELVDAMRYAVLGPGKRVRPVLALASAEVIGGATAARRAVPFGCALEMIHAYSLVHDDLPAMDDDDERRGRPSLHVKYGEALAILTGDALLTEAFAVIAGAANGSRGEQARRALAVVAEVAAASGAEGMVAGQVVDLASEGLADVPLRTVTAIHRRKTGALIRCAVRAGAIAGGASRRDLERLTSYGEALGLAFQIADDILDATDARALIGRTGGQDAAKGKATYPAILGVEGARRRARKAADDACDAVRPLGARAEPLAALVRHVVERAA